MSKHINFVGYTIFVDNSMLFGNDDPDFVGYTEMKVLAVEFPEGEEWGCDFCTDASVAVYEIDAESALGEAGHNTMYCQRCATFSADNQGPDEWVAPWNLARMQEIRNHFAN